MATTPNFGWVTPAPTDFVTDLPADFETFADAVDADVQLIKNTADAALPETIIDAAGDLIYGSAADTAARLAIGTAGQVLAVNSGATAPEWIAAPSGGISLAQIATGTTTSGTQLQLTGLSSYDKLILTYYNVGWGTNDSLLKVRINNSSSLVYNMSYLWTERYASNIGAQSYSRDVNADNFNLTRNNAIGFSSTNNTMVIILDNCKSGFTSVEFILGAVISGSQTTLNWGKGIFASASAVSSIEVFNNSGYTLTQGDYTLWGG